MDICQIIVNAVAITASIEPTRGEISRLGARRPPTSGSLILVPRRGTSDCRSDASPLLCPKKCPSRFCEACRRQPGIRLGQGHHEMVLCPPDVVTVESTLYQQLKRDMGKNFQLYADTVGLVEWKKKGPFVPPAQDLGCRRNALAFPPLATTWSLRQTKEVVKDTGKAIRLNEQTKNQLFEKLGERRTLILKDSIGFDERPARDGQVVEKDIDVFYTAWGKNASWPKYELNGTWTKRKPHPVFKDTVNLTDMANIQLGKLDDDRRNLVGVGTRVHDITRFRSRDGGQGPHSTKVKGKFYWPHMTNAVAPIPVKIETMSKIKDLSGWLKFYGEPHPDKIPTGTMTTFEPLAKIVAGGRSNARNAVTKVDGRTWKREFDAARGFAAESPVAGNK